MKLDDIVEYASRHQQFTPLPSLFNLCSVISARPTNQIAAFTWRSEAQPISEGITGTHFTFHSHQECMPIYCDATMGSYAITVLGGQFRAAGVDFFTPTKCCFTKGVKDTHLHISLSVYTQELFIKRTPLRTHRSAHPCRITKWRPGRTWLTFAGGNSTKPSRISHELASLKARRLFMIYSTLGENFSR